MGRGCLLARNENAGQIQICCILEAQYQGPGFPCSSVGKESPCSAGDLGSIPGSGKSPGEGNGNPLQYSCLENPMDRGAWRTTVRGVTRVRHDWATKPPRPGARAEELVGLRRALQGCGRPCLPTSSLLCVWRPLQLEGIWRHRPYGLMESLTVGLNPGSLLTSRGTLRFIRLNLRVPFQEPGPITGPASWVALPELSEVKN